MLDELTIEITKTATGLQDYVQIRSPAAIPVNIVLVANKITVSDHRGVIRLPAGTMEKGQQPAKKKKTSKGAK